MELVFTIMKGSMSELYVSLVYKMILREKNMMKCAPFLKRKIVIVDSTPWFNAEILRVKINKRKNKKLWWQLQTDQARENYKVAWNNENRLIVQRKHEHE